MNQILDMVREGSLFQKGLFLMVVGIGFVFAVQVIFYLIIRLWPKKKKDS